MVKIYLRWIADGRLTLADIPPRWRAAVEAAMGGDGA